MCIFGSKRYKEFPFRNNNKVMEYIVHGSKNQSKFKITINKKVIDVNHFRRCLALLVVEFAVIIAKYVYGNMFPDRQKKLVQILLNIRGYSLMSVISPAARIDNY